MGTKAFLKKILLEILYEKEENSVQKINYFHLFIKILLKNV